MINYREISKSLLAAFTSQGISLCVSVVTALFVPKVLGIEQYGYWQLLVFYSGFSGFFCLGLNEGIYLLNGGKTRKELETKEINSQFRLGMLLQIIIAFVIFVLAQTIPLEADREFVICMTAINLILYNASSFLGYIFQATNEVKLFSYSVILDRVVFFVPLVLFLIFRVSSFEPYVVLNSLSKFCALVFCIWKARYILLSGSISIRATFSEVIKSIRVGIKLMFANVAAMLVLGIVRFAIDVFWGIESFGSFSFSLSMVNFFLLFVSQIGIVLFPALKRVSLAELKGLFSNMRNLLGLLLPSFMLLFFPAKWLLSLWLPQYADSLVFLGLLLPVCVFDGKMNLIGTTFLKVLRLESKLLLINVFTVLLSAIGVFVGAFIFRSITAVILLAMLSIITRSIYTEHFLTKYFRLPFSQISIGETLVTLLYLFSILLVNDAFALLIFALAYGLFLFMFRKKLSVIKRTAGKGA